MARAHITSVWRNPKSRPLTFRFIWGSGSCQYHVVSPLLYRNQWTLYGSIGMIYQESTTKSLANSLKPKNRRNQLTQCCTQFRSPGFKILCVLYLHCKNVAFTFKWYGNTWNKTCYSQRVWIGYTTNVAFWLQPSLPEAKTSYESQLLKLLTGNSPSKIRLPLIFTKDQDVRI